MAYGASGASAQATSAAAFASVLQAEHDALGAFISLLQAEQEILVHGDPDRLAAIAPEKSAQIDLLSRVGRERDRFLSNQNLPLSAQGVESWFKREPALAAATRKIWRESLKRAETARQLNINNGLLIESRMQQNRQKLSVLQAAARPDNVYSSSGHMGPFRGGRAIGQV